MREARSKQAWGEHFLKQNMGFTSCAGNVLPHRGGNLNRGMFDSMVCLGFDTQLLQRKEGMWLLLVMEPQMVKCFEV